MKHQEIHVPIPFATIAYYNGVELKINALYASGQL